MEQQRINRSIYFSQYNTNMINTIKSILADAEETLKAHSDSPRVDVELLLGHILNKDRSFFLHLA